MAPLKFVNGPSMTRTPSPFWNVTRGVGLSFRSSVWRRISATSSWESDTGRRPAPMNPVTPCVVRTRCQLSSVISISTRRYPGKNFRSEIRFLPPRTSVTRSVGTSTVLMSPPASPCWTLPSSACLTFSSCPVWVWMMYHCFVLVASAMEPGGVTATGRARLWTG